VDDDLLHHRPALSTDIDRETAAVETRPDRRLSQVRTLFPGESAAGLLELGFEGLQELAHVRARATLERQLSLAEGQVHASEHRPRGKPADHASRSAGHVWQDDRNPARTIPPAARSPWRP
jgi:hypothetical protein